MHERKGISADTLSRIYSEAQTAELPGAIADTAGQATLKVSSLKFLARLVEELAPRGYLEFGSGLSTRFLADFLPGSFPIFSVENSRHYLNQTLELIQNRARVRPLHSPLELSRQDGKWFVSYGPRFISGLGEVPLDLILIDGPLGFFQREAPLYMLLPRIGPNTVVLLDDSHRPYEQATLAKWKRRFPSAQFVSFGAQEPLSAVIFPSGPGASAESWSVGEKLESIVRAGRRLVYLYGHRLRGNPYQL